MLENLDSSRVWMAAGLTVFAGLSTGFGSLIALSSRAMNKKFLAMALGFSAGVMIYVSFVEILAKARVSFVSVLGDRAGAWATAGAFFGGVALIAIIDKLIPEADNPHEIHHFDAQPGKAPALQRTGLFVALVIAIHNFPEGLATFMSALSDPKLGIMIAVAVALHNIPEGIAVAVPVYYATGSRKKAFLYSFLSGLFEPLGALVGFVLLRPFFNDLMFGILFAVVAGIMVFISIDELVPSAEEYGEHHHCIYGFVGGMALMALSLLLFV
jgi:ZIP family zinc transporter